jgi:signal transduction histidine kinase
VLRQKTSGEAQKLAEALVRSGRRLTTLLDSLLDYNKSSLGLAMQLHRMPVDLGAQCQEEIELLRLAFPRKNIDFEVVGDTQGAFDGSRVREALANLVSNAAQHSHASHDIKVGVTGSSDVVEIFTENVSAPIPPEEMNGLFDPLRRRTNQPNSSTPNLGLGLFIVREIARAHAGEVTASMANGLIRFKIVLPKADVPTVPAV